MCIGNAIIGGVYSYGFVGAYELRSEKKKQERERERKTFWLELGDKLGRCRCAELICPMGDISTLVGDVKVIGVIDDFRVAGVNKNIECILFKCWHEVLAVCKTSFKK